MNRGEQENLYRQCHTFRLQQDDINKAHKLHLQNQRRSRGYSQGNIHSLSNIHSHTSTNLRSFGEDRLTYSSGRACDDLVLSVLKTPVRDAAATAMLQLSALNATAVIAPANTATTTTFHMPSQKPQTPQQQQQLTILPTPTSTHSSAQSPTKYQSLQAGGSEDELVDDVESAKETTKLSGFQHSDEDEAGNGVRRKSSGGFKFLRRFRPSGRSPKFEEHHRRTQTPLRRRSRGRSHADILDGVPPPVSHGNDEGRGGRQGQRQTHSKSTHPKSTPTHSSVTGSPCVDG